MLNCLPDSILGNLANAANCRRGRSKRACFLENIESYRMADPNFAVSADFRSETGRDSPTGAGMPDRADNGADLAKNELGRCRPPKRESRRKSEPTNVSWRPKWESFWLELQGSIASCGFYQIYDVVS
jgi:hypothetical protein